MRLKWALAATVGKALRLSGRGNRSWAMSERGNTGPKPSTFVYAYCHGFLSGPSSFKGTELKRRMAEAGVDLHLLNLNGGDDPGGISYSGAINAVKSFYIDEQRRLGTEIRLRLIGSSLGGYVVARYAELYPAEVDRIFMLCPGFNLASRWPALFGDENMRKWERDGQRAFPLPGGDGRQAIIPWTFVQDGLSQPAFPAYTCPALVIHGLGDDTVPAETTRHLVEEILPQAKLTAAVFVQDDHALTKAETLRLTAKNIFEFFDLGLERGKRAEAAGRAEMEQEDVEVERKFVADRLGKLKDKIGRCGGNLVGEHIFTDVYWDGPSCCLTERNWWLRSRSGCWELKLRSPPHSGHGVAAYKEITRCKDILKALHDEDFLPPGRDPSLYTLEAPMSLESVLEEGHFSPFAQYRTNRLKYRLGDMTIDIDKASYGYEVVEVEAMSSANPENIAQAREQVLLLAQSLGIPGAGAQGGDQPVRGKLEEYIFRFRLPQFQVLERHGIFDRRKAN
ncbi:unnamed protein product [Discosporangium mesarthrocarpum]